MTTQLQENPNHRLLIGLVAGGVIGAGLTMLLAPRMASEIRQRVTDSATGFGKEASRRYQDATTRVADVVDAVTAKGQAVRNDVADAVGRGAREIGRSANEVERFATASKTGHTTKQS